MAREFINTSLYSDANLVAYYKLEDVNDSKNSYTLTNNGTTTFAAGKFNNAADFGANNTSKYLSVASNLGITGGNFSGSAWINITTAPATNTSETVFCTVNDTTDNAYEIRYSDDGGTKKLRFNRGKENVANQFIDYNVTLTPGTWYHVVWTYDGTNVKGYLNGSEVASGAASGNGSGTTANRTMIGSGWDVGRYFMGLVDDVAFFSRALTASEVKSIYTSRTFQKDTNNSLNVGLVSYYKLGDIYDFYGSNNLTNNGGATFTTGKYNNGASFNGSSQYLSAPNGIFPWGTNKYSVNMWVKLNSTSGNQSLSMTTRTSQGLIFYYTPTVITHSKPNVVDLNYTWTGADTNWHMWTFVGDGSGMRTYLDGNATPVASNNNTSNITSPSTDTIEFGAYRSGGLIQSGWYLNGLMDEVAVYSKALSTTEISDLYNSGNGQTMNPPIEFDNATAGTTTTATSLTFSHTCGAGANRILFVTAFGNTTDVLTGATYNGTAMTLVDKIQSGTSARWDYLWVLHNPTTGANNVVISASSSVVIGGAAASYYGAKQTSTVDSSNKGSADAAAGITVSTTSVLDNCWTVMGIRNDDGATAVNANAGTIKRIDSADNFLLVDSGNPISPAGSTSLGVALASGTAKWGAVMASFAPFVSAAGPTNLKSWNGVAKASIKTINGLAIASVKSVNGIS